MNCRTILWPLLLTLLWAVPGPAQNPFWREPLRLTNSPYYTNHAEMAQSGGIIHVVCNDSWSYGENGAYYYHSLDGGLSFSQGTRLDADTSWWANLPKVAASGLMVHTVYSQYLNGNPYPYVAYRRSFDGGFHWEDAVLLGSGGAGGVACQGDSVYVLYTGYGEPLYSFCRYSYDRGEHWSTPDTLVPFTQACDLAACDGKVFIAYQHYTYPINEIYLRRSLNGGQSWEDPVQVSLSPGTPSQAPHIAVESGGFTAVSWFDHENAPPGFTGYIQVRTSSDYGENFDSAEVVSTTPYCTSNDVAVSQGCIHVAYTDEREGLDHSDVYYRQSQDGGNNWGQEVELNNDSGWSQYPTLVAIPDWVYVAWETNDSSGYDLYFVSGETQMLGVNLSVCPLPESINLQIFPNPFNPVSCVQIELTSPGLVDLGVYDFLGRKVSALANGWFSVGQHNIPLIGSGMSSGVYWIRFKQGASSRAKLLAIIR